MYTPGPHSFNTLRHRYRRSTYGQIFLLGCILTCLFLIFLHATFGFTVGRKLFDNTRLKEDTNLNLPPTHKKTRESERSLPQHNLSLPFPEGSSGRYVIFKNQIQMLGWNNVFNELLLNTWLAYRSGRAYVFQDYYWEVKHYPWTHAEYAQVFGNDTPHTPLSALLSGLPVGGSWGAGDPAPRSVSEAYFNTVCPPGSPSRRIINTRDVKPGVASADGQDVLARWEQVLREAPEGCVEIRSAEEDMFPQTFDLWLVGSTRVLSLWEEFRDSPVSKLLGASPVAQDAVRKNEHRFIPEGLSRVEVRSRDPFDHVMALHLRRGDYAKACADFARYNSTFYLWSQLPFLPDRYSASPPGQPTDTPENIAAVKDRCFPSIISILDRASSARKDYAKDKTTAGYQVDTLFLLTNDKTLWLDELKTALLNDGWKNVVTSADLVYETPEEIEVGMTVDMEIARRTAIFIGNGWSSFTANIVHRRLVDSRPPSSIRFF